MQEAGEDLVGDEASQVGWGHIMMGFPAVSRHVPSREQKVPALAAT